MGIRCFIVILLFVFFSNSRAQENKFRAMDWKFGTSYNSYLLRIMHTQYARRDSILNSVLQSPDKLLQYRNSCYKRYIDILGEMPAKTPLNSKITHSIHQKGFRIENIVYESLPNHHVTANLYIPEGNGIFPAVLLFCGHEITSKATESYQKTARLFALQGFIVMVTDCISQGEMIQLTDENGKSLTRGSTTEHTLLNAGSNLLGTSVAAYELWDNIRALDYLESRREVDKDRMGCLGNSGGGTQTMYFIGFDPRIKAAAPCSFITRRGRSLELANAADGCQHIPFEGREYLEMSDFLILFAPKPLLILAGIFDFVDYQGTTAVYTELKNVYSCLKKPEQVSLFAWEDGHGISKPKREAAVTWFKQWLCNDSTPVKETEIDYLPEKDLFCTSTGQVNSNFSGEVNIQDYNASRFEAFASMRKGFFLSSPDYCREKIMEILGIHLPDNKIWFEPKDFWTIQEGTVSKGIIHRENEIPIPCLFYVPVNLSPSAECVVWLNEGGKVEIAEKEGLVNSYMHSGIPLLLADLRGMGETADKPEANDPKFWNREYRNAMLSLHIGRSIMGQRVIDLLSVLDYLNMQPALQGHRVKVVANGICTPVALHTAYLDKRIAAIHLTDSIPTYLDYIKYPLQQDMYSNVLYGIATYYDLPDIANRLKMNKIQIIENFKYEHHE